MVEFVMTLLVASVALVQVDSLVNYVMLILMNVLPSIMPARVTEAVSTLLENFDVM